MKRLALLPALFVLTSCSGAPQDPRGAEMPPAASEPRSVVLASGGANLVVHVQGRTFVMLENELAVGVATGEPGLLAKDIDLLTVTRPFDTTKAPADVLDARSRMVTVVADSGTRCAARVTDVMLFAQVSPAWDAESHAHTTDKELAAESFELGERGAHYALELDLDRESCTGAHFALLGSDAETARPQPVNEAAAETAIIAFRELPLSQENEGRYVEYLSGRNEAEDKASGMERGTSWDTYLGQKPSVHRFVLGEESLLFVTAGIDGECGAFNAQLSALFRETPDGPVLVRTWEGFSREPLAIVAAPTGYDVIFQDVKGNTSAAYLTSVEPQYFGCRC
jgi:hypothetical protein